MTTYLHIGAPKTGTTFIQNVLADNRDKLAGSGVGYPGERRDHWFAARDLLAPVTGNPPLVEGAWADLVKQVHAWTGGTVVVSHEHFRLADQQTIKRIMADLGPDLRIIVTARDFARQTCSLWQETVKNGNTTTFRTTLSRVQNQLTGETRTLGPVARTIHIAKVLEQWATVLPPSDIHLVTMPHREGNRVWDRFAGVIGVDATAFHTDVTSNPGMGVGATEFLRRLNESLAEAELTEEDYFRLVKHGLANRMLATQPGAQRVTLPAAHQSWLKEWAEQQVEELGSKGYTIAGDLDDLLPAPAAAPDAADSDATATEAQVAEAAVYAAERLVLKWADLERRQASGPLDPARRARSLLRRVRGRRP